MAVFSHSRRHLAALAVFAVLGMGSPAFSAEGGNVTAQAAQDVPTAQILYDVMLAEIAVARGRLDVAVPIYLRLLRTTNDARVAQRATEVALFARRMDAAQAAARVWAQLDPRSRDAQRVLSGTLAGATLSLDQIEARLDESLADAGARVPGALLGLNRVLGGVADKAAAQRLVNRVTEPYLEYAEAHFARAHAAYTARDEVGSLAALDEALIRRPDWSQAILLKAQILQEKDPRSALHALESFLAAHPGSADVQRGYGRALIGAKRYAEARTAFEAVLSEEPGDQTARYTVAMIALEMKDFGAAKRHLLTLKGDGYHDTDAIAIGLGQVAEGEGRSRAAIRYYDEVSESPRREQAQMQIARVMAAQGNLKGASMRLRALGDTPESRANYLLVESQLLRDAGRLKDALVTVDKGLLLTPDDPDLLYESAMLAERMGRLEVMEGRLRKLIALNPDYAHAYNALGYSMADRGDRLEEAETLIRKAVELKPDDPFIMDSLGWVRFRRGALDEARDILSKAYALRPDPEIAAHLGEVLWKSGDAKAARQTWREAADEDADNALLKATMRRFGL